MGWAVALYSMHYNFCRVHQTLRVTPVMEAGLSDHVWTLGELAGLLKHDSAEAAWPTMNGDPLGTGC
jgi:hypothetical protein